MKKILPIIAMIGSSTLIVGLSSATPTEKKDSFINNINSFKNEVVKYANSSNINTVSTNLNKYALSIQEDLDNIENPGIEDNKMIDVEDDIKENNDEASISFENETQIEENQDYIVKQDEISSLYSLSSDITSSCDDFCKLKEEISSAIIETQNLINKVKQKEITLSSEQKMFITEQAQQLKNLGRNLSNITTELSFSLNDINQLMTTNNQNIDNLSLKYLVVLDNLINGNEMLQSGLASLNLINQMFSMNSNNIPSNNQGRILYGFRHNNNEPIIKDYYIDENGNMIENKENNQSNQTTDGATPVNEDKNTNIDTYKNSKLNSNIDTYNNTNIPNNIDTFFNTALLDNEFMYGNRGYAMNGMYGATNPNMNYYAPNTTNDIQTNYNTQHIDDDNNNDDENNKEKKRIKIKKNIDTFKDENEPDIKTKLGNIKNSITGFFNKFKKTDSSDKIQNPVYRFNADELNS